MAVVEPTMFGDWLIVCGFCHGDGIAKHHFTHTVCRSCNGVGRIKDLRGAARRNQRPSPHRVPRFDREFDRWRS
jgi:hypothetical protein